MAAVFHHHRHGDGRVLHRCEGYDQSMVEHAFRQFFLVIGFFLANRKHLSGAAFGAHMIAGVLGHDTAGATVAVDHRFHGVLHALPVPGILERDIRAQRRMGFIGGQGGYHLVAIVGQDRRGHRQLQRGGEHEPLTDTGVDGVAVEPGCVTGGPFPFPRRHIPFGFVEQVDAGGLADGEADHEIMHAVDTEPEPHIVEVSVAGLHHRFFHIHLAMPPAFPVPVTVGVALEAEIAGIVDGPLPTGDTGIQARQTEHGFHRGARWITALQGTVEQRVIVILLITGVVLVGNAGDEQIGVETGAADKGEHAAIPGIDGDHRAAPLAEGVVGGLLYFQIQGQTQIVTGYRRLFLQNAQDPAAGIGFHLTIADLAVQPMLVIAFHTGAAVIMSAAVVTLLGQGHVVQILGTEAVDVPEHMGKQVAVRVVAHR